MDRPELKDGSRHCLTDEQREREGSCGSTRPILGFVELQTRMARRFYFQP